MHWSATHVFMFLTSQYLVGVGYASLLRKYLVRFSASERCLTGPGVMHKLQILAPWPCRFNVIISQYVTGTGMGAHKQGAAKKAMKHLKSLNPSHSYI
jgi:hypothetical protein